MLHMKIKLFFSFVLLTFLAGILSCGDSIDYSQSYIILSNRQKVGKLIVNEKTDIKDKLVYLSEQEMDIPGSKEKKRIITSTKTVFQKGESFPVSYSCELSAGTSYTVKVEDGQIIRTLNKKEGPQVIKTHLEPGIVMLDLTVFHTIEYWIRNYDLNKGERQVFKTYLLPYDSIEKVPVIPAGITIPEHETKALQLKNFEIEIRDGRTIMLWVDKDNHLYRMFIKGPDIEVIRTDLFSRLNKKKNREHKKS